MRLLIVADDFPLPTNSGGRIDMWRRLQALQQAGVELALLSWYDAGRAAAPDVSLQARALETVKALMLVPITRSAPELLGRLAQLGRLPSHAAARWVTLDKPALLAWAKNFNPDVILLDRLFGVAAARWLASELQRPWAYRSHNREAFYMGGQLARAQGWRARLGLQLNQLGLARLERQTLAAAPLVLDISAADAQYWQQQGLRQVQWLPPIVGAAFADALLAQREQQPDWDLLYFGNLNTPNNLEALAWWVDAVLTQLPNPALRIAVAGSRPSPLAHAIVARDPRIRLLADPAQMAPLLAAARVLVNPMRSGSGVNLKSVEMLFTPAHLLSTSVGVAGMPAPAQACFGVADEAVVMARLHQQALAAPALDEAALAMRQQARTVFEAPRVAAQLLAQLRALSTLSAGEKL